MTREQIEAGPRNIWRYKALLPGARRHRAEPQHGARLHPAAQGAQPRPRARHRQPLGQGRLHQPDQLLQGPRRRLRAERGPRVRHSKVFACPSTGNLANAVAAAGARAGIKTVVFIPANLEKPKQVNSAVYTDSLVAVNGNYDDVNRLASEIAGEEDGWAFVNVNVRPYYAEGSKTLGYEIAEQLGWRLPDQIVIPVASGSQLTKVHKAFQELIKLGLVEDKPYKVFGAQATGCSPGLGRPTRPASTRSARSSRTPSPRAWRSATRPTASTCSTSAAQTGGAVEDITDDEVRDGHRAAGPHRGHLHRDRGRHHGRRAEEARRDRPARPHARDRRDQHRPRASRPSTRSPTGSGRRPPSSRRTPPSPRPASVRVLTTRTAPRGEQPP